MNNRERAMAILNYQDYDRMPIVHFAFWDETLEKWYQEGHISAATEKAGCKKLVSIAPWYREGRYAGFALIVLDLPAALPNIVKD